MNVLLRFNLANAELNPIRHLPALVGAQLILHVSRVGVNRHFPRIHEQS
jgi:hypothetical protein